MAARLQGKSALVTGASRGIGRAIALALAGAGAEVLVHYNRGAVEADSAVEEIRDAGGRAEAVGGDLSTPGGAHALAAEVRRLVGARLDVLVASAGVVKMATIEATTVEDFDWLFAVNVRAPFFLVQQLLPLLGEGSSVILLSSLAARAALGESEAQAPAYAATKGAIETLTRHFAAALGPRGIRVNAIAPGVVETEMAASFTSSETARRQVLELQALKRIAQPADIGAVAAFLAGDDARWITGDSLHVDGGSRL